MSILLVAGNLPQRYPGDIIEVRANGSGFGSQEQPPKFFRVNVPDAVIADFIAYQNKAWKLELDYEVLVHQLPTDGYRIRVWNINESATDQGINYARLTQSQIENYLNNWNGEVVDIVDGKLRFDIGIYNMICSDGFWNDVNRNIVENSDFTEINYNQSTGIHRVEIDYSGSAASATPVEKEVMYRGGVIISHASKVITFDIQRNDVLQYFKNAVKEKLENYYYRRTRHHLTSTTYGTHKTTAVIQSGTTVTRQSGDEFNSSIHGGALRWDDPNGSINSKDVEYINSDTLNVKGSYSRSGTVYWFEVTNDEATKTKAEILADITDKTDE